MTAAISAVPRAFIWRRIHSLMGLWFVLFLIEHLLTNSQAALWLGDNGKGFVAMVNALHNLPFLQVIELTLIGIPIALHGALGVKYLFTAKFNSRNHGGAAPYLPLRRNRAYTWQRITSWILLVGIIAHVTKFRFLEYPEKVELATQTAYLIPVSMDDGLYHIAERLGATLYDAKAIAKERASIDSRGAEQALLEAAREIREEKIDPWTGPVPQEYSNQKAIIMGSAEKYSTELAFVKALEKKKLAAGSVVAVVPDFGAATLLAVRDTFKSPIYIGLYTLFVIAACFHACNGFWTFLLTWGWVLKMAAQRAWVTVATVLMAILLFLGLAAVWGTYWINLRY